MALDGNERKILYRNLINDPATQTETKKYSFTDWERKLLGDEKAIAKLAQFSVGRNWAIDENDFVERYVPEFKSAPAPKPQAAPVQQFPVGIAAPGAIKGAAPSVTDIGREMAFEPAVQQPIEPIEPVGVMAPPAVQEPIPSITETAREMAFKPPVQPQMPKEEEERGFGEWAGDVAGTIAAGGKRITKNLLGGVGYFAQAQAAADPMLNIPYEKKQEMMQEAGQTMYDIAEKAQKDFQAEVAKRNIQTDVLQAIENKQYKKIPEATLYTIGDAAMQIVPALLTGGGSSFMQTLPTAYKDGVEAIAKEKGISPEQVIASGDDAILTATLTSGIVGALDKFGAEKIGTFISTKAGYKAVRDWLLKQNINKKLATAAQLLGVGLGESGTEYLQEGTQQTGAIAAKSPTLAAFFDKLPKELFTAEAERQRRGSAVGGLIGGVGLAGGGRAIVSGLNKLAAKPAAPAAAPEAEAVTAEEVTGKGRTVVVNSLEEVPVEYRDKVIEVQTGLTGRLGIGKKQYAYVVPAETEEVVVPPLEEEQDLGFLDESTMTPEEQAAILAEEETAPVAPVQEFRPELPEIQVPKPEGFAPFLRKLGYTDEEISKMTFEQQQEIAINKTEPARAAGESKVDVAKENQRVEKVAEAQRKIDEEIAAEEAASEAVSAAPVEPAAPATEEEKQKSLEDEVESIKAQIKSLRSEDGSVPPEKRGEFNRLTNLLNEATANVKRGNSTFLTVIKIMPEDSATQNPTFITDANEKAEAADLIEQAIKSSKTWEEAVKKIRRLGYVFDVDDNIRLANYLKDRFNPDAPRIGNNKDSFQAWVNGKTDAELTALAEEAPAAPAPKGRKKKEAPVTPAPAAPKKEGKKAEAKEEKDAAPSFTSSQSSEAATAFDKAKTSKGFDKKHGKGAYKALSDITKNFDDIMDNLSDKIKQDCL